MERVGGKVKGGAIRKRRLREEEEDLRMELVERGR